MDNALRHAAIMAIDAKDVKCTEIANSLGFTLDEVKRRAWFKALVMQAIAGHLHSTEVIVWRNK